jgi:hypothetical protein
MNIRVLAAVAILALLLVACGPASPSASPGESEPAASQAAPSEPAASQAAPSEAAPSEAAATVEPGEMVSVFDLSVGDCINMIEDGSVDEVERVACDTPHGNEVYFAFDYPGDALAPYPGDELIRAEAETECEAEFADFVGMDYQDSELYVTFLRPSADTWAGGDREILCTLYLPDELLTGSMEGANR